MKETVVLRPTKETPGTIVFSTADKTAPVSTVYVKKLSALALAPSLTLTLDDGK
jgi:hypothetical protein